MQMSDTTLTPNVDTQQILAPGSPVAAPAALPKPTQESLLSISERIKDKFEILNKVAHGVVDRHIRSLVISGAPGCGKTRTLEEVFDDAVASGKIEYTSKSGTVSAIGLYMLLHDHCDLHQVLVLDDCDAAFADEEAVSLLKVALDTGKKRRLVSWNKASKVLEAEGYPKSFEFHGSLVVISNTDFIGAINRGNKIAPHYKAFMDRSVYLDMGIHTKREILVRISQVVNTVEFRTVHNLSKSQVNEMFSWLHSNLDRLNMLSIRTVLHIAGFVNVDTAGWKKLAENTLLAKKQY